MQSGHRPFAEQAFSGQPAQLVRLWCFRCKPVTMEEIVRTQIVIMRVSVDFSRFTFILVTLALLVLVGCSRPPEIIGIDNPDSNIHI